MTEATIAQVCMKARTLILRDGWTTGGGGWHGFGGWCIEGALGRVIGVENATGGVLSNRVNGHPAGMAIREHLGLHDFQGLADWNDRSGTRELVLQTLAEVAARHPLMEVTAEFTEAGAEKPVTRWESFMAWFNAPLRASTTPSDPEVPDDPTEPSEGTETPSEDLPVTDKELVSV